MSVQPMKIAQTLAASFLMGQVVAPRGSYETKSSMLAGVLLMMFAEDADKMAERLHEENAAMREIFLDADDLVHEANHIRDEHCVVFIGRRTRIGLLDRLEDDAASVVREIGFAGLHETFRVGQLNRLIQHGLRIRRLGDEQGREQKDGRCCHNENPFTP